jgi:hypothetical protein
MKPFRLFTILSFFFLLVVYSCEPSHYEAEKYLQKVNSVISGVIKMEDSLIVFINSKMLESSKTTAIIEEKNIEEKPNYLVNQNINKLHKAFEDSINLALEKARKLPDFDGNTDVKNSLIKVLTVYKNLCLNEYLEIVEVSLIPSILYTEEDDNNFMRLSAKIDSTLEKNIYDFNQKQKSFLAQYQKK